tara:strand:- start:147 stop:890 length:744 start_codon:yes stop_codon:yes gene_type:complete
MDLCIFVHYNKDNIVSDDVIEYLEELLYYNNELIFITNISYINLLDISFFDNLRIKIITISNIGYDYGKIKLIYTGLDLTKYNNIIITNDSVILVKKLNKIFDWVNTFNNEIDFWGITDSNYNTYHLHSYFLGFRTQKAILALNKFFEESNIYNNKQDVIINIEMKLTTYLYNNKCKSNVYISVYNPKLYYLINNHTNCKQCCIYVHNYKELIDYFDYPFLKKSVKNEKICNVKFDYSWWNNYLLTK